MKGSARRRLLKHGLIFSAALPLPAWPAPTALAYPAVRPRPLVFPRDFGAHPDYRTEWWYLTGWLGEGSAAMGFQVTFFRSRMLHPPENPSRFAPHQLMFAHAALALPEEGRLRHADLAGRVGPAGVSFDTDDTLLKMSGWRLARTKNDVYQVSIPADDFLLTLEAIPEHGPVLRGDAGYSQKGPSKELASYYYSRPQLKVSAELTLRPHRSGGARQESLQRLSGRAWFDHEWSSSLLMDGAVGWDWVGINLIDGGSLMAFRIRDAAGRSLFTEWDWRDHKGEVLMQHRQAVWQPFGQWRSARSLAVYPEGFLIQAQGRSFLLKPFMQDQEVDARASTGGFYYEGATELSENGKIIGRGYLELTGYGAPLAL